MLLYHGSNQAVIQPQLIEQTRGLDFGAGFYLTANEKQAMRFSEIVLKRGKTGVPTVSVYDFDMETAKAMLDVHKFKNADSEWLHFVVENRFKTYKGKFYDIIIGAVANDTVMPTLQALLGGFLTEEATILTLKTSKLADQVCLKSDRALSLLRYIKFYKVKKAVIHE